MEVRFRIFAQLFIPSDTPSLFRHFLLHDLRVNTIFLLFRSLPTDIQAEAIPAILGGGDVLMVSAPVLQDLK